MGQGRLRHQVDGTAGLPSAPDMPCAPRQLRLVPQAVISLHARGPDPQALGSVESDGGLCPKPAVLSPAEAPRPSARRKMRAPSALSPFAAVPKLRIGRSTLQAACVGIDRPAQNGVLARDRDGRNLMAAAGARAYKEGVQRAGHLGGCPVRSAYLGL